MEFNIGDLVAFKSNFTHPHKIINKGNFYSEISPNHSIILYQISEHKNEWFDEEELQLWIDKEKSNEFTKQLQKECFLCQTYGNPGTFDGKYCFGFEPSWFPNTYDKCEKCPVFIENHM